MSESYAILTMYNGLKYSMPLLESSYYKLY